MDFRSQQNGIERVLILGHSGFIGTHLSRWFRSHMPGVEVLGEALPNTDLCRREDAEKLAPFFGPGSAVIMCAAIKRQLGDNLETFSKNVALAVNVCRLLESHPVGRFVFFSSAAVYGEEIHNCNITEETPVHPTSFYGAAKHASECLFRTALAAQGSSLLILRPPLVYGPGDSSGGYGPSGFIKAALTQETITLWGDGSEKRGFVFVEDVAEIVCRLTFKPYSGVLNVASGESYTYLDILNVLSRHLGREIVTASRERSKNKVDHRFSNALLTKELPGFSFTSLETGIHQTIAAREEQ